VTATKSKNKQRGIEMNERQRKNCESKFPYETQEEARLAASVR